jgi:hypothetical protein
MASPIVDRETILQTVQSWPHDEQLALAQEIIRRAITPPTAVTHASFEEALGMLATPDKPAPTDEEIARWRMEKYGEAR